MTCGCSGLEELRERRLWDLELKLEDKDPLVRERAAYKLGKIGPEARGAYRMLDYISTKHEPYVRGTAIWASNKVRIEYRVVHGYKNNFFSFIPGMQNPSKYLGIDKTEVESTLLDMLSAKSTRDRLTALVLLPGLKKLPSAAYGPLIENLKYRDARIRFWSTALFRDLDPEAGDPTPHLISLLQDNDSAVRLSTAVSIGKISRCPEKAIPALLTVIKNPNEQERIRAAALTALNGYGPDAVDAIPALVDLMENGTDILAVKAADALINIGSHQDIAIDLLIKGIEDDATRFDSLAALNDAEHIPAYAAPVLIEAFNYCYSESLTFAIKAFENIDTEPEVIDALIAALASENSRVGVAAARTIGLIKTSENIDVEPEVLDALIVALASEDTDVVDAATRAIGLIGQEAEAAIPALIEIALNPNFTLQAAAIKSLGKMGPREDVLDTLCMVTLEYGNKPYSDDQRDFAADFIMGAVKMALVDIATEDPSHLIEMLNDESDIIRSTVIRALQIMGHDAYPAIPALIEILNNDESPKVQVQAAFALPRISHEPVVINALLDALDSSDEYVSTQATWGLEAIGPDAKAIVPSLLEMLNSADPVKRSNAAGVLSYISSSPEVVDALINSLRDEDDFVRSSAAFSLFRIGPDAEPAIPDLIIALGDEVARVRSGAVRALGAIGTPASDAIPHLIGLLDDEDDDVMSSAARALGQMGPLAKDALPKLEELALEMSEDEGYQYRTLKDAIKEIEG